MAYQSAWRRVSPCRVFDRAVTPAGDQRIQVANRELTVLDWS
jgi:hypothetical protein